MNLHTGRRTAGSGHQRQLTEAGRQEQAALPGACIIIPQVAQRPVEPAHEEGHEAGEARNSAGHAHDQGQQHAHKEDGVVQVVLRAGVWGVGGKPGPTTQQTSTHKAQAAGGKWPAGGGGRRRGPPWATSPEATPRAAGCPAPAAWLLAAAARGGGGCTACLGARAVTTCCGRRCAVRQRQVWAAVKGDGCVNWTRGHGDPMKKNSDAEFVCIRSATLACFTRTTGAQRPPSHCREGPWRGGQPVLLAVFPPGARCGCQGNLRTPEQATTPAEACAA